MFFSSQGSGIRSRISGVENAAKCANSLRRPSRVRSAASRFPVGKEQERCFGCGLLAHEEHRNMRAKKQQGQACSSFSRLTSLPAVRRGPCYPPDRDSARRISWPPAEGDRSVRPAAYRARGTFRPDRQILPSSDRARCCERPVGKGPVISLFLARQQHVQGIVEVISPLRIVERCSAIPTFEQARLIGLVFEHQVYVPAADLFTNGFGQFERKCRSESSFKACTASKRNPSKP